MNKKERVALTAAYICLAFSLLSSRIIAAVDVKGWEAPINSQRIESLTSWGLSVNSLQIAVGTNDASIAKDAVYHIVLRNTSGSPIDICPAVESHLIALTISGTDLTPQIHSFSSFQPATDTLQIDAGQTYVLRRRLTLLSGYDKLPSSAHAFIGQAEVSEAKSLSNCQQAPQMHLRTSPIKF